MAMSSNKRRKIDPQDAPQSTASAVSAVAARRRLGMGIDPDSPSNSPSTPEPKATFSSSNAFSVLQNLSRQGDSPSLTATSASKALRSPQKNARPAAKRGEPQDSNNSALGSSEDLSSRAVQFSSFRPTKKNSRTRSDGVMELRLSNSERFLVLGSFGVRVLEGELTVAGATLRHDENIYWIHAPHCHAIPVLRTKEHTRLELHRDENSLELRQLGRLSPLFRRIWNEPTDPSDRLSKHQTFQILCSSEDAPKKCIIQDLVSPPEWNKKLSSLMSLVPAAGPFTTLVCGPKSSGKSTFTRLLTNRLLTRRRGDVPDMSPEKLGGIAIMDLDPGQPEYAIPGTLSLVHVMQPNLTASFTHASLESHASRVIKCHALASVSPASNPDYFRECAMNLANEYKKALGTLPLIINTPGWILGTGLELLEEIIQHTSPSEVIYMSEEGPAETVDVLSDASSVFSTLPSQQCEFTMRTAAHLRAMQTMSYFHLKQGKTPKTVERSSWHSCPLSTLPPWEVRYSGSKRGIKGILSYDYQTPPSLLAGCINGTVLAAVEIEDPKAYRGLTKADNSNLVISRTPEGLPFIPNPNDITLDPQYSRTIGLVLIRGIDTTKKCLQLITPISIQKIEQVKEQGRDIVLVYGKFDAPSWVHTEESYLRAGDDDEGVKGLQLEEEDTSEDDSDAEPTNVEDARDMSTVPWVEIVKGNQRRPVGSKVWRVRRDLGKSQGD